MYRKLAATVAAIAFFTGTTVSFAENAGGASSPSSGQDSSGQVQEPPGNTSSTHNPQPSSTAPTGLNGKDGETGTVTSTHYPPKERCVNSDCPSAPGK